MKTEKMFEINEEVMIKVKVVNMEFKNGEIWYQLKDNTTGKVFDYLFARKDIVPCESTAKVTSKKADTVKKTAPKKMATTVKAEPKTTVKKPTTKRTTTKK